MNDKINSEKSNNDNKKLSTSKQIIEIPSLIEKEEDSLEITGSTAASDINYYFDELKQQNNE